MRFFPFLPLLALPATVSADAQAVLNDITAIRTQLTTLTTSVDGVVPGIPGIPHALQVQVDATVLDKHIQTGARDAASSPPFGSTSLQVGLALIALQPAITDALAQISEKNGTFGELGVIVLQSLVQLKRDTGEFSGEIVPKLGALEAAIAPVVIRSIEDAFDGAIGAYLIANL
ncbi:hydrophobic surface binding protein A-domain-containing protein [Aspergillus carlsbadensis]|nr:hydrophobic surface binding protein A-domain-containing protein [Aspergillus carlsbadensis]